MKNLKYQLVIAETTLEVLMNKRESAMTEGDWYIYNERIINLLPFITELKDKIAEKEEAQ